MPWDVEIGIRGDKWRIKGNDKIIQSKAEAYILKNEFLK